MAVRAEVIHAYVGDDPRTRATVAALLGAAGRRACFIDEGALPAALPDAEVLLSGHPPRIDWSSATRLRLLHLMGSGVDTLWPAAGLAPAVVIANARGIHAHALRDHALGMMLAFARDLPRTLRQQGARRWQSFEPGSLAGRTVGLVGLGEANRALALAGAALGMRVLGVRARPEPTPGVEAVWGPGELPRLLRASDYVVVAVPLTARTRGMLGAAALAELRPEAVLVQLSRGEVLDEVALDAALRAGRLRGAALDVFATEPLPATSPLWDAPNLILSPHVAGRMPDYVERAMALFLDNLARFEEGLPLRTLVDRAREY